MKILSKVFFVCLFVFLKPETVCLVYASPHYHLSVLPFLISVCECNFCQKINEIKDEFKTA